MTVVDWLLDSDPSIRWQTLQGMLDAPAPIVEPERARVAGQAFFSGEAEPFINGMVVRLGTYFGQAVDGVVDRLMGEQLEDGGWNWEAIDLVRAKEQPDGTWLLENTNPGEIHFAMDEGDGLPSRWNTLRALRVLRWAERTAA